MIRCPLGLRLDGKPGPSFRQLLRSAASAGAQGVVLEATGDLSPDRLGETGRRELRHLLRSIELGLAALALPTRRSFDDLADFDERVARIDRAMRLAFELGTSVVLLRPGQVPAEEREKEREAFLHALGMLARRADHRGVRIGLELEIPSPSSLLEVLHALDQPTLGVSLDPVALLALHQDPPAVMRLLGSHVVHAYAPAMMQAPAHPSRRSLGERGRSLDWAAFLGACEEVGYHGYLTIWPEPGQDAIQAFLQTASQLARF
jgi:sugar phosphate isomerase/epimerase